MQTNSGSSDQRVREYFALDLSASGRPVSLGAVIAAAVFLDFEVRTWRGVHTFSPDVLIAASLGDVRR